MGKIGGVGKREKNQNPISEDATPCIPYIYYESSKCGCGNDSVITIYKEDHTIKQQAVLATILRMQSGWPYGLEWREGKRGRETKPW